MLEDLRDRLARSLSWSGAGEPPASAAADLLPEQDRFVLAFLRRAERIVVPAMREAGGLIERQGRFFSIEVRRERTCRGVVLPVAVQMNLFRRCRTTNFKNQCPHVDVVCDAAERKVLFQYQLPSALGGQATPCGRCALEQLDRALAREKIGAMLEAIAHH